MYDRLMNERNYNPLLSNDDVTPIDPTTQEFAEIKFHFDTLFNDTSKKINTNEAQIHEIENAYSLKNQYISLNFEKREMNEVSAYGWFNSEITDEKKIPEIVNRLRAKGLEKIEHEIMVSALPNNDDLHYIILCKFIVGESEVIFQDEELNEEKKEKYKNNYDTIVRVLSNANTKDSIKRYNILKEENIELLYLIKIKGVELQNQLIECSNPICPYNELNNEKNEKDKKDEKSMYFCLLKDNYLCNGCHNDIHLKEVFYGKFDTNRCEQKKNLNLPGECPNSHPNKKSFDIDYFCTDCLKGICSYCKVYGNEKHPDLHLITELFNKSKLKLKDKDVNVDYKNISNVYSDIIKDLNRKINGLQMNNKNLGDNLRNMVKTNFQKLFDDLNEKFTDEGEKLVSICYQLNFLKDNLLFYNTAYNNKEALCLNNNLKQELFWTKRTHLAHLLYLIEIKEKIKTKYKVDENCFDQIINKYLEEIDERINQDLGDVKHIDIKKEDEDGLITIKSLVENAKIPNNDFNIK